MRIVFTSCLCTLTGIALLLTPWALSASEEQLQGKPDRSEQPQDRSGMVARESFRVGKRMGAQQERVRAMMKHLDSDGDHRISLDEFEQTGAKQFSSMDSNENGELTLKEMKKFQLGKLEQRIEKQFAQLDRNGDNRVTADEMRQDRFTALDKNSDGYLTPRELFSPRMRRPAPPDLEE